MRERGCREERERVTAMRENATADMRKERGREGEREREREAP